MHLDCGKPIAVSAAAMTTGSSSTTSIYDKGCQSTQQISMEMKLSSVCCYYSQKHRQVMEIEMSAPGR